MKNLKTVIGIMLIIISIVSIYQITFANNNTNGVNKTYNFYISTEGISCDKDTTIFLANSVNKNTLLDNKIAPRYYGKF